MYLGPQRVNLADGIIYFDILVISKEREMKITFS